MYALFIICNAFLPMRLDDNIANISKERFSEQYAKISRGGSVPPHLFHRKKKREYLSFLFLRKSRQEGLNAFEELFIYACPKFMTANPPPYDDAKAINAMLNSVDAPYDATQRQLAVFLSDVTAQLSVPTLRSFLKLYTSLGAKKLAKFLDVDEEEMVQEMMVLKQASQSLSRVPGVEGSGLGLGLGLLNGRMTTTSDLNFVIDEVSRLKKSCTFDLAILPLTSHLLRIWCISLNLLLVDVMRAGSSRIRNGHKRSMSTWCRFRGPLLFPMYLLQRRLMRE